MRYEVQVMVNGKWEAAKQCSTMSAAKGFENQCRQGGYKTRVVKL